MQVQGAKKSLGTRIFVFVTVLVVVLVGFISGKNGLFLFDTLKRQYQASLIDSVQLQGGRISALLGRWDTKLIFVAQTMQRNSQGDFGALARNFLATEGDLKALQYAQRPARDQGGYVSFVDESLQLTAEEIQGLTFQGQITLQTHPRSKGYVIFGREMKTLDSEKSVYTLAFFETKSLLQGVGTNSQQSYFLLDRSMKDLVNDRAYEKAYADKNLYKKVAALIQKELSAGYLGESRLGKERYYVAYQSLQPYPLHLLVHQKINLIQSAITSFFTEILQWTLLFLLLAILMAWYVVKGLIAHLYTLSSAVQELAKGNFSINVPVKSEDEIGYLSASFNWMAKKLVLLLEKEREKARLEQELVTAQTVQKTFFKTDHVETACMTLHAHYKPASECSGDLWGHIKIRDGMDLVFIGDATGHGAPAALVTALAYAAVNVRSSLYNSEEMQSLSPAEIMNCLNELLWNTLKGRLCMSFLILIFDEQSGSVQYSNAGHTFPFLIPKDAQDERLGGKKRSKSLSAGKRSSGILGIDPSSDFVDELLPLQAGDRIVLYTDGLTEAKNDQGKLWGTRGVQKVIEEHGDASAADLKVAIVDRVVKFNEKADLFDDDLTLLIVDFHRQKMEVAV